MNTDTTAARAAKAPAFTSDLSIDEISEAIRMMLGMRQIANQTSLLANHWRQEGLEDFADDLCRGLDEKIDVIEAELRARPSSADIDDVLTLISITLYPGKAGREDHPRMVTA
ncbi:hypothetical protein JQ506_13025 [Shinella sp. PSBB067]|uniref:hypothetical protein n=1 Tax=Shinella sp. PSBB067 TaxID=2715959 RepID=UPI00193B28A1|nr:hypothetical protein [Shinella sp. PSBB067]QRI61831.1 hypothetical protein JQ506_13025 [Shinella sp. PSBB067]